MKNKFLILLFALSLITFTNCSNDDDGPDGPITITIEGATITPVVGGPNQQNQVYVDLSTNTSTSVRRDSWDLGFNSTSNRVVINGSIYMAVGKLSVTDIDAVTSADAEVTSLQPQVAVATFDAENMAFVDNPNGDISGTAIDEISVTDADNHVYIVNLGFEVGTETPATGSVAVSGDARGWKKIRVLRNGDDYVMQYADLDATTHQEITISKDSNYNFTFFSFNTEAIVNVEPEKEAWDLNFTVFTNEIPGFGSYGYTDYVVNNLKGNAKAYMVDEVVDGITYEDFTVSDVINSNFSNDQRSIGSSWRNGGGPDTEPSLKEDLFYVVNDANGNLYKLQFIALTNAEGVRGYPQFVYSLLQ